MKKYYLGYNVEDNTAYNFGVIYELKECDSIKISNEKVNYIIEKLGAKDLDDYLENFEIYMEKDNFSTIIWEILIKRNPKFKKLMDQI